MKKYLIVLLILLLMPCGLFAAQTETIVNINTKTGMLEGSLIVPEGKTKIPVALIISGSGPTDRDGNNPVMKNNSLKLLAGKLSDNGIASLRYDKRGVGKSRQAGIKEEDLRFDDYISDAVFCIEFLKKDKRFNEIIIIGHSEGSLLGMIASRRVKAGKFISIAGAGMSADKILKKQLQSQPYEVQKKINRIIDRLVKGETVAKIDPIFLSLFRPSVQPYLISWFKYDPAQEIARLSIPVLIVQGTADIQVGLEDAHILAKANLKSKLVIIKGMNHILKEAKPDRMSNLKTYNQPYLPIKPELIEVITEFIK